MRASACHFGATTEWAQALKDGDQKAAPLLISLPLRRDIVHACDQGRLAQLIDSEIRKGSDYGQSCLQLGPKLLCQLAALPIDYSHKFGTIQSTGDSAQSS